MHGLKIGHAGLAEIPVLQNLHFLDPAVEGALHAVPDACLLLVPAQGQGDPLQLVL